MPLLHFYVFKYGAALGVLLRASNSTVSSVAEEQTPGRRDFRRTGMEEYRTQAFRLKVRVGLLGSSEDTLAGPHSVKGGIQCESIHSPVSGHRVLSVGKITSHFYTVQHRPYN